MNPEISRRSASVPASPIRGLVPYAEKAMKNGKKVFFLNIGQPDVPTPTGFFDAVRKFQEPVLAYGGSHGNPDLVRALAHVYREELGVSLAFEDVLVTAGGSEALWFAIMTLCDPGDELAVPEPFYANYAAVCAGAGVRIVPVTTRTEDGYHLPAANTREALESLVSPRTRGILLSHPGNPSGTVFTREEVNLLASVAVERNLSIIADEVYRDFVYDGLPFTSFASLEEAKNNVVVIDSISKRYSACGARIGFIVSRNAAVMEQVMKFAQSRGCTPTLEQLGAAALYETPPAFLEMVRSEYQKRRDVLCSILSEIPGVTFRKPEGAFYLSARIPVDDAETFAIWMMERFEIDGETVLVAPLSGFYATAGLGKDEIRLCYALEKDKLARAGEILKEGLAAYPGRKEPSL
ncbi:MAG: pyridoxal phosphate-dependent aminotransferase [Synergistales bacterium]